jgi:hypothetical protein
MFLSMQVFSGHWGAYAFGLILLLCAAVWTAIGMAQTNRAFSQIVTAARPGIQMLDGCPLDYWLEELNRDSNVTLLVNQSYILSWRGNDYWLIDGKARYMTFGRFGPLAGQSSVKCLIAAKGAARDALAENPHMFRRLIAKDTASAFAIRRLSAFANIVHT